MGRGGFRQTKEIVVRVLAENRGDAANQVRTILESGLVPFEITRVDDLTTG